MQLYKKIDIGGGIILKRLFGTFKRRLDPLVITEFERHEYDPKKFEMAANDAVAKIKKEINNTKFKIFNDYDEIEKWCEKHCISWVKRLNNEEIRSLTYYGGNQYNPVNKYLRGLHEDINSLTEPTYPKGHDIDYDSFIEDIKKTKEYYDNEIKKIDSAINKFNFPENITVFRRLDYNGFQRMVDYEDISPGDILTDKGYMSTDLIYRFDVGEHHFHGGVLLIMRVPKNANGALISVGPIYIPGSEVLLARGTKFKIDKVIYHKNSGLISLCSVLA